MSDIFLQGVTLFLLLYYWNMWTHHDLFLLNNIALHYGHTNIIQFSIELYKISYQYFIYNYPLVSVELYYPKYYNTQFYRI